MKQKLFQTASPLRLGRLQLTRNVMLAFVSMIAASQATIIEFKLSPAGTDDAVGLSPANEVATVVSTGSGNAISGGITFDTDTSTLNFTMGYGSAAGFTNLTGAATAMHIHGPAAVGVNASVVFDLASSHFPSTNPANGGILFGSLILSANQTTNLLAGLNYVNIHTTANTGGELRGQLIRTNVAPEVVCSEPSTIECGMKMTYSAAVSDFDGDAVQAVWSLNGAPVETDNIAAGGPPSEAMIQYKGNLPLGINTLGVTATDSFGNVTTCTTTVTVVDTIAPVIVSASVNPKVLSPPNHKLVPVEVTAKVTDACGATTWKIISVSSNQPVDGRGSGKTSPDWKITDDHTVLLRAERSGKSKSDRVYTIKLRATDEAGNVSNISTVKVTVPHDQGKDDDDRDDDDNDDNDNDD